MNINICRAIILPVDLYGYENGTSFREEYTVGEGV
jgi:hypothetical protein